MFLKLCFRMLQVKQNVYLLQMNIKVGEAKCKNKKTGSIEAWLSREKFNGNRFNNVVTNFLLKLLYTFVIFFYVLYRMRAHCLY